MPRRGGGGMSRPSPTRNTTAAARPAPPQPVRPAPPAQAPAQSGGMFSGLGSTLMQGMAFGAGSEVAHQAVRSVIGGGSSHQAQEHQQQPQQAQQQQQQQQQQCFNEQTMFSNCLKQNSEITMCQSYMDMFKECQKRYGV